MTLPPALDGFLGVLGVPWPNIDEDEIRKDAAAWRTVQAQSAPRRRGRHGGPQDAAGLPR
ncbi:hypothetical protein [Planomonospora algeriensis]